MPRTVLEYTVFYMVEDWEIEAHKLVDAMQKLGNPHRQVMKYFLLYRSVGDLLAVRELKEKYGIKDAERVIIELINKGLLEKGDGCINLPPPLRRYVGRKKAKITL
ncbi:MAG: hypothetical protein GSR82_02650 [Desulfurococcales archaeon]|nr:hypothetical protein [Desulfurococcales archaeon]MEB3772563.1 hypothetical protein [Desulfurococcales archaeon]MEB3786954.1 hypothetical protein [Desulfurococcales archaeon]MEB3846251.1 hypothetical protein [Desulfurococcales archaeon]